MVHHVANLSARDRVVCKRTAVIEAPFQRILEANDERDADWQLLEVERERLAGVARTVAVQSYGNAGVGGDRTASVDECSGWRCGRTVGGWRMEGQGDVKCTRYMRSLQTVRCYSPRN